MSSGFSIFVVVVTLLNIAAAVWLLLWMRKRRGEESSTASDTTGHVWDGDLCEYNNPLPRWWLWLFILSVIFSLVYLVLYPGMGNARGTLGWTQQAQFEAMQAEQERKSQAMLAQFADRSPVELTRDPQALAVGRNLFANNCAACHGSDGRGAIGFPNLTDNDWLWGGEPDMIEASIRDGRQGVMAPWIDLLGPKGVDDVSAYVLSLSGRKAVSGNPATGKAQFETICVVCHGVDGTGNPALGAPNLADNIWVYGGSQLRVNESIAKGRMGVMPEHGERLGEVRVKLLTAYVISMGGQHGVTTAGL
ncbi:MAG: cytochrome-c oxidase, cbb3-type subunit III [Sinobacteraceae bacterium]|nr:cytochrome-c oxidase, cbb3-type subunit III [Nevskiaceae bacterium]